MATGSGKTMIARLRIEAELLKSPGKLIWFTTPNVVLAEQQHAFFRSQLRSYNFKLLVGTDNVHFWSTQAVWDAVLKGYDGVISTPEILHGALVIHSFVRMFSISLLIFDEAHHCIGNNPANKIMQMYHRLRLAAAEKGSDIELPAILGLTASPIMHNKIEAMEALESNLNAVCRSPTLNLEDYERYVHLPELMRLEYAADEVDRASPRFGALLSKVLDEYDLTTDPTYLKIQRNASRGSIADMDKLGKVIKKHQTPVLKELKRFFGQALHVFGQLGALAADRYICTCIEQLESLPEQSELFTIEPSESRHLRQVLLPVFEAIKASDIQTIDRTQLSTKFMSLLEFLAQEFGDDTACIVFVERKAMTWALNDLLSLMPELQDRCRSFALVGTSNVFDRGLADLFDRKAQAASLNAFREGRLNTCVATSVLEEGIDVQACNLVLCFDDTQNVKSFIQRRGRARRPGSKYVICEEKNSTSDKYEQYASLERQMKEAYAEQDRKIEELQSLEDQDEEGDEDYIVPSTGATLSMTQARTHLSHFCDTLPQLECRQKPAPIYLISGAPGSEKSCKVLLPASLPAHLQSAKSARSRLTEKMAKKDAAFRAYVALHKEGLVTDHLLPPARESLNMSAEGRQPIYEINALFSPWSTDAPSQNWHTHRIAITDTDGYQLPSLLILLPIELNQPFDILLHVSRALICKATVTKVPNISIDLDVAKSATQLLFTAALKRRLPNLETRDHVLPYFLIPEVDDLATWLESSAKQRPLAEFNLDGHQTSGFLLTANHGCAPYFWSPPDQYPALQLKPGMTLNVVRLSRQMHFLLPAVSDGRSINLRDHEVEELTIHGLDFQYVKAMLFMPSISHIIENMLRAQAACLGPLRDLQLNDFRLVATALTASGAGQTDYQRLEHIGDSLLKYLTSVNIFCANPNFPESHLSIARDRVVSNARLQRVTREMGLDAYFSDKMFSAQSWTLVPRNNDSKQRNLSSKVLADLVEALLGAAYADGGIEKVLRALVLFLPEVSWDSPSQAVSKMTMPQTSMLDDSRLATVESVIGHKFNHRSLLLQALTHSTSLEGHQTYERLEYLGDAVIDIIVKQRLFGSPIGFTEGQMTERHSSLVNKDIFAYLTTKATTEITFNDTNVDLRSKETTITQRSRTLCLHDHMASLSYAGMSTQRDQLIQRYTEVKDDLYTALLTGGEFPWSLLYHLASPKWASDILESIIGAVYIDSSASLETCENVLRKLGLMHLVDRAASDPSVEYGQPLRRLREKWPYVKVNYRKWTENEISLFACRLEFEDEILATYTGATCKAEAENRAAEIVLERIEEGDLVIRKPTKEVTDVTSKDDDAGASNSVDGGPGKTTLHSPTLPDENTDEEQNDNLTAGDLKLLGGSQDRSRKRVWSAMDNIKS